MPRTAKAKSTSPAAKSKAKDTSANLGLEAKLWTAAVNRSAAETSEGNRGHNMEAAESHAGKLGDLRILGQESNATTRRLAIMNLASRGIKADFWDRF